MASCRQHGTRAVCRRRNPETPPPRLRWCGKRCHRQCHTVPVHRQSCGETPVTARCHRHCQRDAQIAAAAAVAQRRRDGVGAAVVEDVPAEAGLRQRDIPLPRHHRLPEGRDGVPRWLEAAVNSFLFFHCGGRGTGDDGTLERHPDPSRHPQSRQAPLHPPPPTPPRSRRFRAFPTPVL